MQNLRICGGSRPTSNLTTKREEKGEKDACLLPKLGWLATYVGYVPFVPLLSVLGGDIHPTTVRRQIVEVVKSMEGVARQKDDVVYPPATNG